MATRKQATTGEPIETDEPLAPINRENILEHIEVPYETPEGIRQVNAVMHHPISGRRVRHEVIYDSKNQTATEREVGLKDGKQLWERDVTGIRWCSAGLVYVEALDEAMKLEAYVDLRAFDEAPYRLGVGFSKARGEYGQSD